jgi:SAM-dependent methyltransferase
MQHDDHVALLRPGVPRPGGVWADFGSGGGAFTLALADLLGPGGVIYSIDRDGRALRQQAETLKALFPGVSLHTLQADFTRDLRPPLPPLDGLVMANALHFVPDAKKAEVVNRVKSYLRPGGRWLLVEYNVDRGNLWVPHPLAYPTWEALALGCGFTSVRKLAVRPSSFLKEFYSAESV